MKPTRQTICLAKFTSNLTWSLISSLCVWDRDFANLIKKHQQLASCWNYLAWAQHTMILVFFSSNMFSSWINNVTCSTLWLSTHISAVGLMYSSAIRMPNYVFIDAYVARLSRQVEHTCLLIIKSDVERCMFYFEFMPHSHLHIHLKTHVRIKRKCIFGKKFQSGISHTIYFAIMPLNHQWCMFSLFPAMCNVW